MTGHRHTKNNLNNHPLRKGVKRGHNRRPDLHPLRRCGFRAQELIEFALIFPVLMLFVFGIVDFGRVFQALIAISNAAREGARYGVIYGLDRTVSPFSINEGVIDDAAIQEASNYVLTLTVDQVTPSCPNTCISTEPLRVEVTYTFTPIFNIRSLGNDIQLRREMEMMIP